MDDVISSDKGDENMRKSWLLVWNPSKWNWENNGLDSISELKSEIDQLGFAISKWSCGVNKSIQPDDHIFLIRLGVEPRGIIAYGTAISNVFEGTHWDIDKKGTKARRVYVKFLKILNTEEETIIGLDELYNISNTYHWLSQISGISIPDDIAISLLKMIEKM